MSYSVPQMPLVCTVWRGTVAPPPPRPAGGSDHPCQLRMLKTADIVAAAAAEYGFIALLLPKGTDVRASGGFGGGTIPSDYVEAPKGSGRFYVVQTVDDVAKGFPNEYRMAVLSQFALTTFPIP